MAMVKVRAAWQRTTNHCFVQEDAKRAPKLACCQSSSSSSKQVDGGPTSATNILDNSAIDFLLCTGTLHILTYPLIQDGGFNCNLVMGTKKVLPHDDRHSAHFDGNMNGECSFDNHNRIFADRMTTYPKVNNQEANIFYKSLDYIGNCDLLPPQKVHVRRYPYGHPRFFDHDDTIPSSLDWKAQNGDTTKIGKLPEGDLSKAQLLEAILRSQTRVKEAEKECKLFLSQNSQLFAYKEWFEMLQLEILYYQVKNGEKPISTLFLVVLPRIPLKGRNLQKSWQKFTRGKHGRPSHDISKYVVAFALGLSIVGASLLLGWVLPL
ncbi:hypothetical protein P3X46_003552 [Hevea brasiliensis]|uniref:Uncharacterized protein n=1 Tax=Hevea brasiliensis TaxID=3981 RepID=A0ABQ9N7C4_HEVBR|nr:hypothetical protein P3X46_003552 [Hevea brasiliensis]